MRYQKTWFGVALGVVVAGATLLPGLPAFALCPTGASCPAGVSWGLTGSVGERIYQCMGDMSTSSHEGASDADGIQDALIHPGVTGEPTTAPHVRIVTIVPAANGQPCNMKATLQRPAGTVWVGRFVDDNPANPIMGRVWLRGSTAAGSSPPVLKLDAESNGLQCDFFMGNAAGNVSRVLTSPTQTSVSQLTISDLVVDGSNATIAKRFSGATCTPSGPDAGVPVMRYEGGNGVFLSDVDDCTVDAVVVHNASGDGIVVHGTMSARQGLSKNVAVTRCLVFDNSRVGINPDSVQWGLMAHNRSAGGNQYLFKTENAPLNVGHSLWVDNQTVVDPISVEPEPATPDSAGRDFVIARNRVDLTNNPDGKPFNIANTKGVVVAGNTTRGGYGAVGIGRGAQGILVRQNTILHVADRNAAQAFNMPWAFYIGGNNDGGFAANQNFLFAENQMTDVSQGLFLTTNNQSGTVRGVSFVGNALRGVANGAPVGPLPLRAVSAIASELLVSGNQMFGFHGGIQLSYGGHHCPACDVEVVRNSIVADNVVRGALGGNTQSYGVVIEGNNAVPNCDPAQCGGPCPSTCTQEASPHGLVLTGNDLRTAPSDPCFAPMVYSAPSPQPLDVIPALNNGVPNGLEIGWNAGVAGVSLSGFANQTCGAVPAPVKVGGHVGRAVTGTFTVPAGAQSAVVTLPVAQSDSLYTVGISTTGSTGTPPTGAFKIRTISKQANQFTATLDAATGTSTVTFNWMVMR